jgi:hypothetical protein
LAAGVIRGEIGSDGRGARACGIIASSEIF